MAQTINYGMEPDLEQQSQELQRRQMYLDQMRKQQMVQQDPAQMVSGRVVKSNVGAGLSGLLASYLLGQKQKGMDAERKDLTQQSTDRRAKAHADYLTSLEPTPAQVMPDGVMGPAAPAMPKSSAQLIAAHRAAVLSGDPRLQGAGQFGMQDIARTETREDMQADRAFQREQATEAGKLARAEQREQATEAGKLARAEQHAQQERMIRLAAALRPAAQPVQPKTVDGADGPMILRPDGTAMPIIGPDGKPVKGKSTEKALPTSAAQKLMENQQNLRRAEQALGLIQGKTVNGVKGDPNATGKKGYLPDAILQRADSSGVDTRAAIADLGSLVIHDRSGAAVTASEFPRLRPFIPSEKDDPAAAEKKLKRFVQEYKNIVEEAADFYKESGYKVPTGALRSSGASGDFGSPVDALLEKYK